MWLALAVHFAGGLHLTGDVVFGMEKGGREILVGVLILAVTLAADATAEQIAAV